MHVHSSPRLHWCVPALNNDKKYISHKIKMPNQFASTWKGLEWWVISSMTLWPTNHVIPIQLPPLTEWQTLYVGRKDRRNMFDFREASDFVPHDMLINKVGKIWLTVRRWIKLIRAVANWNEKENHRLHENIAWAKYAGVLGFG